MIKTGGSDKPLLQAVLDCEEEAALAVAERMIQVKAPTTLPEGYKLDVQVGPKTLKVAIPPGGVQEGQTFQVPFPGGSNLNSAEVAFARVSVPTGNWRDGVCDCCAQGICHPSLCNSYFCHTITIAQVMTRMKLNLWAKPIERRHGAREIAKKTFNVILIWTIIAIVYSNLSPLVIDYWLTHVEMVSVYNDSIKQDIMVEQRVANPGCESLVLVFNVIRAVLIWPLAFFAIYWTTRTRSYIRQKYGIPARYCGSSKIESLQASTRSCHFEDFCCSLCCHCCTISQMARHTMDYDTFPATCCTPTGVRDSVPDVV